MTTALPYPAFDADNHYYEALDAFTRHVPKQMQGRCVQWAEIEGRKHHVVGGRVAHAVKNPTWNPIAKPGAMYEYFRGNPHGKNPLEMMREREALPAYYMDHDARLRKIDEQGLEGMWLFPTLGVLYEELLKHDREAVTTLFSGFNRWLDDDWGFAYRERIFGAAYLTLADCAWACRELEWALSRGARVVVMRPAAVFTAEGPLHGERPALRPVLGARPGGRHHGGRARRRLGYTTNGYARDGFSAEFGAGGWKPSVKSFNIERAAYDFLITLAYEKLFERFPRLRIASVENGSEFLPDLFRKLRQSRARMPGYYKEDPVELFKRNVWINPFWEDDVRRGRRP